MLIDEEIKEQVYKLDELISKHDATVAFSAFGETAVYANKSGYLRLGIELMKRAYEGRADGDAIEYLMDHNTEFNIDYLETDRSNFDKLSEAEIDNIQVMEIVVRKDDSIEAIVEDFNTSISVIKKVNPEIRSFSRLRAGSILRVPRKTE